MKKRSPHEMRKTRDHKCQTAIRVLLIKRHLGSNTVPTGISEGGALRMEGQSSVSCRAVIAGTQASKATTMVMVETQRMVAKMCGSMVGQKRDIHGLIKPTATAQVH